jgi:murein DD-endopeptidase MepM/ murein hydrolase activator NlpD
VLLACAVLSVSPALAQSAGQPSDTRPPSEPPSSSPTSTTASTTLPPGGPSTSTTLSPYVEALAPTPEQLAQMAEIQGQYDEALAAEAGLLSAYEMSVSQYSALNEKIAALDPLIAQAQLDLLTAEEALVDAESDLHLTTIRLEEAEAELADARTELEKHAVEAYINGGDDEQFAGALLSLDDIQDIGTAQVYIETVLDDQRKVLDRFLDRQAAADDLRRDADRAERRAAEARDDAKEHEEVLREQSDAYFASQVQTLALGFGQQELLGQLQAQQVDYELRLGILSGTSDSVTSLLARLQAGQTLPTETDGIFAWPIIGDINSDFGPRIHPIFGTVRQHNGLDIDGNAGDPAFASERGIVVMAEGRGGYGNLVVVDHGNGLATLYAHLTAWAVRPGDVVERGALVGYVGSTGFSTGPHLHWEVRVQGVPVNPQPFLE